MTIKVLLNLTVWGVATATLYWLFFFQIFPPLIAHYRKLTSRRREYDKEIEVIQEEDRREG